MTIANKFARRLCAFVAAVGLIVGVGVAQAQTVIYYHTDALGSPVATTNAAGAVIERSEYEPYGQLLNRPLTDGPGYTGHISDAQTGLSYMQQRYYDPLIGRFLSMDPVTADANTGGNFNRYWYADNNPYKFTDPDGRQGKVAWLVKLGTNEIRRVARLTKEQAVRARRAGENVEGDRRQISHEIETAAHGSEGQLKHAGHELADGSKGLPHYQTKGVPGHTFWGQLSVAAIAVAGTLDHIAEAVDAVDPVSAMTRIPEAGQPGVIHECANGCSVPKPPERPREPEDKREEPPKDDERRNQ